MVVVFPLFFNTVYVCILFFATFCTRAAPSHAKAVQWSEAQRGNIVDLQDLFFWCSLCSIQFVSTGSWSILSRSESGSSIFYSCLSSKQIYLTWCLILQCSPLACSTYKYFKALECHSKSFRMIETVSPTAGLPYSHVGLSCHAAGHWLLRTWPAWLLCGRATTRLLCTWSDRLLRSRPGLLRSRPGGLKGRIILDDLGMNQTQTWRVHSCQGELTLSCYF